MMRATRPQERYSHMSVPGSGNTKPVYLSWLCIESFSADAVVVFFVATTVSGKGHRYRQVPRENLPGGVIIPTLMIIEPLSSCDCKICLACGV